jgi:hypothetical protein
VTSDRNFADTLVRGWVRLYTVGLDAEHRHDRIGEIDSDLWEHRNQSKLEGEGSGVTSLSIVGRWAAGIPADLSWRTSHRGRRGQTIKESMMRDALGRYWQALAAVTAIATGYLGVRQFFTDEVSAGISSGKVAGLVLLVGAGLLVLAGLAIHRTNPRRGALLVVVGVLPVAAVGGFGVGLVVGLIASLAGGLGWWWLPVTIASAVATVAGLGAFSAWWHASPKLVTTDPRITVLPIALVVVGLVAAGVGVGMGLFTSPLVAAGALLFLSGAGIWTRRLRTVR